jgi:D-glycero-alpha-D-manno-heptose-7-phosphate kinase
MNRLHKMVYEAKEALLKGRIREFGALLHENMVYKRKLDPRVSTPYIDELYESAIKSGAIGGKLLGAGGGGYLLLLVEGRRQFEVRANLEKAGAVLTDFSFQEKGLQVWRSRCF